MQSLGTGGRQIGQGLYILPAFQSWPSPNDGKGEIQWDCIVTIDADEWDKWKKVYLPELFTFPEDAEKNKDTCKPLELWGMFPASSTCSIPFLPFGFAVYTDASDTAERNRQRFVGYVSPGATVENTVLFSKAKGKDYEHLTQGLLPPALIDTDKVYLSQCAERGTEGNKNIGKMGTADWGFVGSLPGYGMGEYK